MLMNISINIGLVKVARPWYNADCTMLRPQCTQCSEVCISDCGLCTMLYKTVIIVNLAVCSQSKCCPPTHLSILVMVPGIIRE